MRKEFPREMNLQLFAQGDGGEPDGQQKGAPPATQGGTAAQGGASPAIDYDKLASIIAGKQNVTEDKVLNGYFRQQGLSKEEIEQAVTAFKAQKKANEPDVDALQTKAADAAKKAAQAVMEKEGILLGLEMGLDAKAMPYILKMADSSEAIKEDGTIDSDKLKEAINQVLSDIPALKPNKEAAHGFRQMGSGGGAEGGEKDSSIIAGIFGNTKS